MKSVLQKAKEKFGVSHRKVKFTKGQQEKMRELAILENSPCIDDIFKMFPNFSSEKAFKCLDIVKKFRKNFAKVLGITDIKGLQDPKLFGFIYLIENEKFDGWIKCGMTTNISKRLSQYNLYDPIKRFKILSFKSVENRKKAESNLIYELKNVAKSYKGEWFEVNKDIAKEILNFI